MIKFDEYGLMHCKQQAIIFKRSLSLNMSSAVFIKRFMLSRTAHSMDTFDGSIIDGHCEFFECKPWGKEKYPEEVMYWVGYIYRYWAYVYNMSSKSIYRIIPGSELARLYEPYHTLDPLNAIKRIYDKDKEDKSKLNKVKQIFNYKI